MVILCSLIDLIMLPQNCRFHRFIVEICKPGGGLRYGNWIGRPFDYVVSTLIGTGSSARIPFDPAKMVLSMSGLEAFQTPQRTAQSRESTLAALRLFDAATLLPQEKTQNPGADTVSGQAPKPLAAALSEKETKEIEGLVQQLGSPEFTERESAHVELERRLLKELHSHSGTAVLKLLGQALPQEGKDPEIHSRLRKLVDKRAKELDAQLGSDIQMKPGDWKEILEKKTVLSGSNVLSDATGKFLQLLAKSETKPPYWEELQVMTGIMEHLKDHLDFTEKYRSYKQHLDSAEQLEKARKVVRAIYLRGEDVTDGNVAELSKLPNLKELNINGNDFGRLNDGRLAKIGLLKGLEGLSISDSNVTDGSLAHIRGLPKLKQLWLQSNNQITDAGLGKLKEMSNLEELSLRFSNFTDAGFGNVAAINPNLKHLDLYGTRVSDGGLANLAGLTKLESIYFVSGRNNITLKGLDHIQGMKNLKSLTMETEEPITDAWLAKLTGRPNMEILGLMSLRHSVTDAGLDHLKEMKGLRCLSMASDEFTDEAAKRLQNFRSLHTLTLGRNTMISPEGFRRLKQVLPECNVYGPRE